MGKTVILAVFAHGGGGAAGEEKGIKIESKAATFLGAGIDGKSRLPSTLSPSFQSTLLLHKGPSAEDRNLDITSLLSETKGCPL